MMLRIIVGIGFGIGTLAIATILMAKAMREIGNQCNESLRAMHLEGKHTARQSSNGLTTME